MKVCPKCNSEHQKPGTFCSRVCANARVQSEESKAKRRAWSKANPRGAVANQDKAYKPPKGHRFGANISKTELTLTCAECQQSWTTTWQYRNRKYCSVECSNRNKHHQNSNSRHRAVYKGQQMDSGAELKFAKLLDQHNIAWKKNTTKAFDFIDSVGKLRKYYPDFYLPQYDMWVEVKGKRYIRKDDELRRAAVGNIELIMSDNIKLPACVGPLDGTRTRLER